MALSTDVVHDAITDFTALLPEIKNVLAERGRNIGDDITTVEHVAEATVKAAANLGVPYAATVNSIAVPFAHQLMGLFATWMRPAPAAVPGVAQS